MMKPSPRDAVVAATGSLVLTGLCVARLTLTLNPVLHADGRDAAMLLLVLGAMYGLVGLGLGVLGAVGVAACARLPETLGRGAAFVLVAGLAVGPLLYALILPDAGVAGRLLTDVISAGWPARLLFLLAAALVCVAAGWTFARLAGRRVRLAAAAAWALLAVFVVGSALLGRPAPAAVATVAPEDLPPPASTPSPVVLLCIDGLDFQVLQPLIDAGELPHFATFQAGGTWGPLETIEPTLSAVIWTTLATGKPPEAHGIHHFLHFRLPGVHHPVGVFPLHTGLNFHVFPQLEELTGLRMRVPYTSNLRRTEALWTIVSRWYPVGVYRWLITWPAESVDGFNIAGGLGFAQITRRMAEELEREGRHLATYPPGLLTELPRYDREAAAAEMHEIFGADASLGDGRWRPIGRLVADPSLVELQTLLARFQPRFLAASFYPVDVFHHLYGADRVRGDGRFAGAIDGVYKLVDRRLGDFLAGFPEDTNVVLVSDHGFDFEHGHHTWAPPGVLLARGPAFAAGRRVEGLGVEDTAPLVLRLLGLPLPGDMPGAVSEAYAEALDPAWAAAHPASRIATYETGRGAVGESVESPLDAEMRDLMRSLGYIN